MKSLYFLILSLLTSTTSFCQEDSIVSTEWTKYKSIISEIESNELIAKSQKFNFMTQRSKVKYNGALGNQLKTRTKLKDGKLVVKRTYRTATSKIKMSTLDNQLIFFEASTLDKKQKMTIVSTGKNIWDVHIKLKNPKPKFDFRSIRFKVEGNLFSDWDA